MEGPGFAVLWGIPTQPRRIWRSFKEKEVCGGSNQDGFPGVEGAGVSVGSLVVREAGDPSIHLPIHSLLHSTNIQNSFLCAPKEPTV